MYRKKSKTKNHFAQLYFLGSGLVIKKEKRSLNYLPKNAYLRHIMLSSIKIKAFLFSILLICSCGFSFSQNNALVLSGAFMVMNGGTNATPIYLVVNQSNIAGITRTSGHIVSEGQYNFVRWSTGVGTGSYVYPFGYSTTDYIPFTFNKNSGNSDVDVSTWATNQKNVPHPGVSDVAAVCCMKGNGDSITSAIDRFWDIRATATNANLTFSYRGAENTTAVPGDPFEAQHWNGSSWDAPVGPGNAGVNTIGLIGTAGPILSQTTFSPWVLSRSTAILPVELIRFSAACNDSKADIKWTTETELNNDFFTVERSPDAVNYLPIGIVNGAGNSSTVRNYSFTDTDPLSGTSYYRLRQTDFNGMTKVYPPASVSSCGSNGGITVHMGNVSYNGHIWIDINGAENNNVRVAVTDMLGRNLYTKYLTDITGSYLLNADLELAGGIYVVSAYTGEKVFSKKIVVVR